MAEEKTEGPAHILTFAGIELDCHKGEARLPQEKIEKCNLAIHRALALKITLKELQSLTGLLNFACKVVIPGRVFLRRLINLTIGVKRPHHLIRLNQGTGKDLKIWQQFFHGFNGKSVFFDEAWCSSGTLQFFTDAAKSVGFSIIFGTKWVFGLWPDSWKQKDISFLEMFPIVLGILMLSAELCNKKVLF